MDGATHRDRRAVLRGTAAGAAGISTLVLPAAAAHATPLQPVGITDWSFGNVGFVGGAARQVVDGIDWLVVGGSYLPGDDDHPRRLTRVASGNVLDTAFDALAGPAVGAAATIYGVVVQADRKAIAFGRPDDALNNRGMVVRVAADGTPDTAFNDNVPEISGGRFTAVWDVVVRSDGADAGKILVAGDFTRATPPGGSAVTRFGLLQLNADGTLDTSFATDWSYSVAIGGDGRATEDSPRAFGVRVLPDGDLLLAGERLNGTRDGGGALDTSTLARLLKVDGATGGLAATLLAGNSRTVYKVAPLSDGRFLALDNEGGGVRIVDVAAGTSVVLSLPVTNTSPTYRTVLADGDDAFIIGGIFTTDAGNGSRTNLVRVTVSGLGEGETPAVAVDLGFTGRTNNQVFAAARRGDGDIAIGGNFTTVNDQPRGFFALLSPTGALR